MDWLQKVQPQEEYILILDADMIILKPFDPIKMGVLSGMPCIAFAYNCRWMQPQQQGRESNANCCRFCKFTA